MSRDIFAPLSDLGPRLDEASRKANEVLKRAKERLAELHLGFRAFVTISEVGDEDQGEVVHSTFLGYTQRDSKKGLEWDLVVSFTATFEGQYHDDGSYSVFEVPRDVRIAAAKALPKLIAKIKEVAEKAIADIDEAAKQVA